MEDFREVVESRILSIWPNSNCWSNTFLMQSYTGHCNSPNLVLTCCVSGFCVAEKENTKMTASDLLCILRVNERNLFERVHHPSLLVVEYCWTGRQHLVPSGPALSLPATSAPNSREAMMTFVDMKKRLNHLRAMAVSDPLVLYTCWGLDIKT